MYLHIVPTFFFLFILNCWKPNSVSSEQSLAFRKKFIEKFFSPTCFHVPNNLFGLYTYLLSELRGISFVFFTFKFSRIFSHHRWSFVINSQPSGGEFIRRKITAFLMHKYQFSARKKKIVYASLLFPQAWICLYIFFFGEFIFSAFNLKNNYGDQKWSNISLKTHKFFTLWISRQCRRFLVNNGGECAVQSMPMESIVETLSSYFVKENAYLNGKSNRGGEELCFTCFCMFQDVIITLFFFLNTEKVAPMNSKSNKKKTPQCLYR